MIVLVTFAVGRRGIQLMFVVRPHRITLEARFGDITDVVDPPDLVRVADPDGILTYQDFLEEKP